MSKIGYREAINILLKDTSAELVFENCNYSYIKPMEHDMRYYDPKDPNHHLYLKVCGSGDYSGSEIDIANRRYIEKEYPVLFETGAVNYNSGSYGYESIIIDIRRPSVARSGLLPDLAKMTDYIILDEDIWTEVQQELIDNTWDWIDYDFNRELEEQTGLELDRPQWLESAYFALLSASDDEVYIFETGGQPYVFLDKLITPDFVAFVQANAEVLAQDELDVTYDYVRSTNSAGRKYPKIEVVWQLTERKEAEEQENIESE